jgi:hypothetical protein
MRWRIGVQDTLGKRAIALAAAATATTGLLLTPAVPASAKPGPDAALRSCYGSMKEIKYVDDNWHWPPYGSTKTTSNCVDINVYVNQTLQVRTCFKPTTGGGYCNEWRTVYVNTWGLAATDVRDGTEFYLLFSRGGVVGWAAY